MRIGAATSIVTDALCRNREKEDVMWMRCSSVGSRDGALDAMLKMHLIVKLKSQKKKCSSIDGLWNLKDTAVLLLQEDASILDVIHDPD